MSVSRSTFHERPLDLDFIMKVPVGFAEKGLAGLACGIGRAPGFVPLLEISSPGVCAGISVMGRANFGEGTVRDQFVALCPECGITLLSIGPAYVGGLHKNHPALLATGLHRDGENELVMSFVAMEDGGRFVVAQALCTRELEPRFMKRLEDCIYSIELVRHKGPTVNPEDNGSKYDIEILENLEKLKAEAPTPDDEAEVFKRKLTRAREEAIRQAGPLIADDRFDEAARVMLSADDSGQGRAALSDLFAAALRDQVRKDGKGGPAKPRALELYKRALQHRLSAYPDPHTQEEADRYSSGMDEDRAEIAEILGYRPESQT
ncbi:MAG: hypothetical protein JNK16_00030 [Phycisphaerales bacterium]|nr:hypothetical protein [Phycisphaerales bacterium]